MCYLPSEWSSSCLMSETLSTLPNLLHDGTHLGVHAKNTNPVSDRLNQNLRGQVLDASGGSCHKRNLGRFPIETEMLPATFSSFSECLLEVPCPDPASFVLRGLC